MYLKKCTNDNVTTNIKFFQVYAPTYFSIKTHQWIFEGSNNLFLLMKRMKFLDQPGYEADYEAVINVVINNSYFFHPENILIGKIS